MKQFTTSQKYILLLILVLFGIGMRIFPHAPNMTPITAIAMVSALYLGKRWAFILPIGIMLLSDLYIGMYDINIMASVYVSFIIIAAMNVFVKKKVSHLKYRLCLILGAPMLFFVITNTAVWFFSPWYEKSISGLFYAYQLGVPFFRNMLIGDVIYTIVLIGVFELLLFMCNYRIFQHIFLQKKYNIAYKI